MLLELTIKVDPTYLLLNCPQVQWPRTLYNLVAYETVTKRPFAIGDSEAGVQRYIKLEPRLTDVRLTFARPFEVTTFDLERAVMVVEYCAMLLQSERRAMWQSILLDTLALNIWFEDYERLPLDLRQGFEWALRSLRVPGRTRKVFVNGRSSLTPEFLKSKNRLHLKRNIADWAWGVLFWGGSLGSLWLAVPPIYRVVAQAFNPPVGILMVFGFMAIIIAMIFTGIDLVASFAYALLLRPWLPADILRTVFLKASHALPKRMVNWLSSMLFADVPDTP